MAEYIGLTAICGPEGTGKTTMALTFPKPLFHMDIDVGGYERASWRFIEEDILSKPYPRPINVDKLMGTRTTGAGADIDIRYPKKVSGVKELWQRIIIDFVAACQSTAPIYHTIVLDTSTMLYNVAHNTHLQELQEKQIAQNPNMNENDLREKLLPIEYGPVYDRMNQLFHTARSFKKNLVLTHYPKDVYAEMINSKGEVESYNTGKLDLDGYKHTAKLMDLVVWVELMQNPQTKKVAPYGTMRKAANMPLEAIGQIIPATFDAVLDLRNRMRNPTPPPVAPTLEEQLKAMQK